MDLLSIFRVRRTGSLCDLVFLLNYPHVAVALISITTILLFLVPHSWLHPSNPLSRKPNPSIFPSVLEVQAQRLGLNPSVCNCRTTQLSCVGSLRGIALSLCVVADLCTGAADLKCVQSAFKSENSTSVANDVTLLDSVLTIREWGTKTTNFKGSCQARQHPSLPGAYPSIIPVQVT